MTKMRENGNLNLINSLFGKRLMGECLPTVFRQIEITTKIVEKYKKEYPLLNKCFLAFHSKLITPNFSPWIFHSHCKEIANRLKKVGKRWSKKQIFDLMCPPTKAEIVCSLSKASMITPLKRDVSALALHYFNKIAKEEGKEFKIDYIPVSDLELKQTEKEIMHYLSKFGEARAKVVWENF